MDMNPTVADYVDVKNGKIHYEIAGAGETLILVHAGFVDSRMWNSQWSAFTQHYRTVRYDLRGYGKSTPLTEPVSLREDLRALVQHLNIDKFHLLGCSAGGEVAYWPTKRKCR